MALKKATTKAKRKYVVVRTYSAGVHVGELVQRKGMDVELANARRIWSWGGAFTLSEIAMSGIKSGKVSVAVPSIILTQAIEVIPASKESESCLRNFQVHKA